VKKLRDIAQAARFEAMRPAALNTDQQAFEAALAWASNARACREAKRTGGHALTPGRLEALARQAERRVREIALQSEILLARRADQLPAGPCHQPMLKIMLGAAA
jgi:hypothetical protein